MMWQSCVGSGGVVAGRRHLDMWCEYLDTEGDKVFAGLSYVQDIQSKQFLETSAKLFAGTGKFEGITGDGESLGVTTRYPEDIEEEFWVCGGVKGSYRLP